MVFGPCARSGCPKQAVVVCPSCCNVSPAVDLEHPPAFYCGQLCLSADAYLHHSDCDDRKDLRAFLRVGTLLQQIYLILCEATFIFGLSNQIQRGNNRLQFLVPSRYDNTNRLNTPRTWFPTGLGNDIKDRQALLCFMECTSSLAHMHDLAEAMLQGLPILIRDVSMQIRPPPLTILRHHLGEGPPDNNYDCIHDLWEIRLQSQRSYFVDLSAPQYGWYESVISYETAMKDRYFKVLKYRPFGSFHDDRIRESHPNGIYAKTHHKTVAAFKYRLEVSKEVYKGLGTWLGERGMTLRSIHDLEEGEFRRVAPLLLANAKEIAEQAATRADARWSEWCTRP